MWNNRKQDDVCVPVKRNAEIIQTIRSNITFATYRTTKYPLPLDFLVVQTNVNYQVAAVIVCQEKTTEMITKALSQIKGILIS